MGIILRSGEAPGDRNWGEVAAVSCSVWQGAWASKVIKNSEWGLCVERSPSR